MVIKIKISNKKMIESGKKKDSKMTATLRHNLDMLLHGSYEVYRQNDTVEIAQNFIEDMINQEFERTGDFDIYDNPPEHLTAPKVMEELVAVIKPLQTNKIVKAITGRSYGKIFKLDNGHILKIYHGGLNTEEDMKWYKKCHELMHGGGAKQTTLPVFAYGEPKLPSFPEFYIGYAEIAEVTPFDKFLEKTGRDDQDGILVVEKLKHHFLEMYHSKGVKDLNKIKEYVKQKFESEHWMHPKKDDDRDTGYDYVGEAYRPLTEEEAYAILEAFYDMMKLGIPLSDVYPRNMGLLQQSSPSNPKIVIFDR
jgi:hypothetical protein